MWKTYNCWDPKYWDMLVDAKNQITDSIEEARRAERQKGVLPVYVVLSRPKPGQLWLTRGGN